MKEISVACVGDSLTFGMGTESPETQSYPARLGGIEGKYHFIAERYGHSGATVESDNMLAFASTDEFKASMNTQAEIVLLMLGTNDTIFSKTFEDFSDSYRTMVQTYLDLPCKPRVILMLPPHFFSDNSFMTEAIKKLDDVIRQEKTIAEELGLSVIDVYSLTEGRFELSADGVHFTPEGYEILAKFVYDELSAILDN